jgi:hypothetical protein
LESIESSVRAEGLELDTATLAEVERAFAWLAR